MSAFRRLLILFFALPLFIACGGGDKARYDTGPIMPVDEGVNSLQVWRDAGFEVLETPAGALPQIPAAQGGAGFEELAAADGWVTETEYHSDGSTEALPGGQIRVYISDYPATTRTEGKDTHNVNNSMFRRMQYETLLNIDSESLKFVPGLASHWKIVDHEDGSQSYFFRIDPDARWQTGHRVTSADVVATWKQRVDQGMLYPADELTYKEYSEPVIHSSYIVEVRTDKKSWRRFMTFAAVTWIYPDHLIGGLSGKDFLEQYQIRPLPGTGRYLLKERDLKPPNSLTYTRVANYWDKDNPKKAGQWNFARIKFITLNEETLIRERFKKGQLDMYLVTQSKYWMKELVPERVHQVAKGWIQKKQVYNKKANGMQGHFFNLRKPPFDDIRVRQAIAHLNDRETMIEKLFYNAYEPAHSIFPGMEFEYPGNPKITHDPEKARQLLAEAGWSERNDEGWLVKDGQVFEVEIMYDGSPSSERVHTVFQENWAEAGIKMNLKSTTWATMMQIMDSREYTCYYGAWSGSLYPDPQATWHSKYADRDNSNNFTGFRNAELDSLLEIYEVTDDIQERIGQLQQMDRILIESQVGALAWYGPNERIAHWNKFGMPEGVLNKTEDWRRLIRLWWYDADKHAELNEAIAADAEMDLPSLKKITYWLEH